jgi:glycosyltransferase involved in cell wall biosynthesis
VAYILLLLAQYSALTKCFTNRDKQRANKSKIELMDHSPIKVETPAVLEQVKEKNIFFVLSTGRSGTKTIAESLSGLPDCLCQHEPAPQLILESSAYRYGRLEDERLRQFLLETRQPIVNGKVYGESNQTLSLIVPVLAKSFPNAKFIWLIRNGLDVVSSIFARQWYTGHSANHDRYEDCPPLEKAWIDGRIMGDLCGDVPFAKWKKMNPFARCCWYWAYINRTIEKDLSDYCQVGNYRKLKLENFDQSFPEIAKWLGFGQISNQKTGRYNRAHYKLYSWQKWTLEERKTFLYWCGPLMDRLYPDWRILNQGFFDGLNYTRKPITASAVTYPKSQTIPKEDNSTNAKSEELNIYFTPQLRTHPKISVYITSYNQKKYLIEAIESVLAQSLKAHEIIIVDDCSNDGSQELIAKYAQKYPNLIFPIYHTKNFGVVQTRLDALNAVTGDYVTYVDGDDRFLPEKLEHEFEILAEHPNAQIAFSNNYYINPAGQPIGRWIEEEKPPQGLIFKETFGRRFPKNSLFRMELVNYQAWKAVGFHDTAITIYEDFDMRIRMTKHFQAAFCDQPLSEIRMHDKGLSNLEAKQHLASLDFIFHKNRHLLDDLTESDRKTAKNGFYDFVNNISRVAANQLAQKHIRKNQNSEKQLHNAIITRSKTDQANGQNELGSNLIFLISQPRAGSTLFQRVLAGHPEIHTTAEPWIMLHPLYALKENGIIAEYRADLAQQGLVDFLGQVPEGIELYKMALRNFASTLYNRALESSGKRFFLDKTPRYYHIIPELYSIFPEAHFIFLLRNPIAVLSSVLKTWYGNRVAGLQIQTLIDLVKGPVRLLDGIKKLKEKAIVVEYESLVQSPETVMLRVCNRIGIPFYEDMLNYGQKPKPKGRFGDSVGIYKYQRPVADNIDKWLKNISSPELTKFSNQYLEALGSDTVSKMGYNFNGLKQKLNSQRPIDNTLQTNLEKFNLLNKEEPLISLITPSLNQGQFIEQTIQSVLKQNYSNFEHIIIDGGSTDRTVEILKQYPHLKWVSEKDNGQSHALNKGLKKAKGDIIAWINSDDWYEPGAFKIVADYFDQNPNKNIVMGDCNLVNEEGKIFDTVINNERGFEELKKYWVGRAIPTQPAIFFRRKLLDTYGCADEDLNYAMDYDLWMRFAQGNHFYHIDEKVANYRFHQGAKGGDQNWNKFVPEWKKISQKYAKLLGFSSLISVIIPSYNYGKYLREAVESVIGQTYQNYEIIIINDGSTDNTKEVAESLIAKYPNFAIRLIHQKNSGQPAISRNRGIFEANGEYILCLDADDMLQPTMLEKCLNVLERDRNIAIAYTDRQDFDGVDQIVQAKNYDFSQLKYANHISYCALFRKEVWDKIGGYRTNIKGCEDWDFWVAAGAKGYFGRRIPEPLFKYRRHDTGVFQEVLENYDRKFAQVILNNQEVYNDSDINRAAILLGNRAEIESDVCPFVSIVVPTFNRPEMLQEALKSILNQTYQNFEIVVVNDGGEDVSGLVETFQDPRIKYKSHPKNRGLAAARNTGIRNASSQYIALLDDDDIFYPEHLQTAVDMLSKEIPVIYTDAVRATYERCGENYKIIKKNVPYSIDFDRNKLLVGNISPVNCFVFDKSLALKAGLFDETLSTLEDWDFWIRLSSLTRFKHIPKPTVQVNWRSDGTTMTSLLGAEFGKNRQKIYDKYQAEINQIPNIEEILNEFQKIWAQDWKVEFPLTSIIILTCNQLEYTKKCLESILQNTDGPYELIIVDNGSTDGTVEFLESEISKKGEDVRIKIIKNNANKGFAGGNNQGMAVASGDYILLMNNDVVVAPG